MKNKEKNKIIIRLWHGLLAASVLAASMANSNATILISSDGSLNDYFGVTSSISGGDALVGAYWDADKGEHSGSVYYYNGLSAKSGTITQSVKLLASDGTAGDEFGTSICISADNALVGALFDDDKGTDSGSAYYYNGLSAKSGTITQSVKLLASDGAAYDCFGRSVSLSGSSALIGAYRDDNERGRSGAAYYYKGLNVKSGTTTQNVKLLASDGAPDDYFGFAVGLSGDSALVGAYNDDDKGLNSGSSYYYKELNVKSGTVVQNVKLLASDGAADDFFGNTVCLSGDNALIGSIQDDDKGVDSGSAYFYSALNTKSGTVTQNVKLLASDGVAGDYLCWSISLSGDNALIGAIGHDRKGIDSGAVYYYKELQTKSGVVSQDVKLLASDGVAGDRFGSSVGLDGNMFTIGAALAKVNGVQTGKAYAGDIRTFTILDSAGGCLATDGITATVQGDWIIGGITGDNIVTISPGDRINVTAGNKAVYVGKETTSNDNMLVVAGTLVATNIYVGSIENNSGNLLQIEASGGFTDAHFHLADNNAMAISGDYTTINSLIGRLGSSEIKVWKDGAWVVVNAGNYQDLVTINYEEGYTLIMPKNVAPVLVGPATFDKPTITGNTIAVNVIGPEGNCYAVYSNINLLGNEASWIYAGQRGLIDSSGTITLNMNKSIGVKAQFYRIVTSTTEFDAAGSTNGDKKYSTNVIGWYDVTIPASGVAVVANQLDNGGNVTIPALFGKLPGNSTVNIQRSDGTYAFSKKSAFGSTWSDSQLSLPLGQAAYVINAGAATTLTFAGVVQTESRSYNALANTKTQMASFLPIAVANPVDIGYVRVRNNTFDWYNAAGQVVSGMVPAFGTSWTGTTPSFAIGQGFYFMPQTNVTWVQPGVFVNISAMQISY